MAIGTPTSIGSAQSGVSGSTIQLTISANVTPGNRVIVFAGCQTAGTTVTFSDSLGNSYTTDASANATQNACFFVGSALIPAGLFTADGDFITATFSGARTDRLIAAVQVSGLATSSPLDKTATQAQSLSGAAAWNSSNTATTTQADELVIGGSCDNDGTTATSTAGASLTELFDFATSNSVCMTAVYRIVAATGAYDADGTWSSTAFTKALNSAVATYKAQTAAAGGTQPVRPLMLALWKFSKPGLPRLGFPLPNIELGAPAGITYQPTGSLTAGTIASGADVFESSETGSLLVDTIPSGADVFTAFEAGSLTTRALDSGDGIHEAVESGSLTAAALLSGGRIRETPKVGSLTAGTALSGADVAEHAETGTAPVGTLLSGVSVYVPSAGGTTYSKTGSLTAGAFSSGADVFTAFEAGSLTTRALASGADSFQPVEAGSLTARALASGADVFTASETGTVPVGAILSGTATKVAGGINIKAGSLVAGATTSGADSYQRAETGSLVTGTQPRGADSYTAVEAGSVLVDTLLAGIPEGQAVLFPKQFDGKPPHGRSEDHALEPVMASGPRGRMSSNPDQDGFD